MASSRLAWQITFSEGNKLSCELFLFCHYQSQHFREILLHFYVTISRADTRIRTSFRSTSGYVKLQVFAFH